MGLSYKQIKYLYAIGAFKGSSRGDFSKKKSLEHLTTRQTMREIGKIGEKLAVKEISSTHQLKIGDTLYPIQKDPNLSTYPVINGKRVGSKDLPPGPISLVRVDSLNAKRASTPTKTTTKSEDLSKLSLEDQGKRLAAGIEPHPNINPARVKDHFTKDPHGHVESYQEALRSAVSTRLIDELVEKGVLPDAESPADQKKHQPPGTPDWEMAAYLRKMQGKYVTVEHPELLANAMSEMYTRLPEAQKKLESLLSENSPMTRVTQRGLASILTAGRFKTQLETNKSMGFKDTALREHIDDWLFNFPKDGNATQRPIYGYIGKPDGSSEDTDNADRYSSMHSLVQYGEVAVSFKPHVRDRTTWTSADSMDANNQGMSSRLVPSPLSKPKVELQDAGVAHSLLYGRRTWDPANKKVVYKPITKLDDLSYQYVEAQIHGGISVSDISHVAFRSHKPPDPALLAKLKKHGIPYSIGSSQVPARYDSTDLKEIKSYGK